MFEFSFCLLAIVPAAVFQSKWIKLNSLKRRLYGSLCFILPILFVLQQNHLPEQNRLHWIFDQTAFLLSLLCAAGLVLANVFVSGSSANLAVYPQIKRKVWTPSIVVQSALTWAVYMLVYEIVFRGIFFSTSIEMFGVAPAIVLNIVVYSLAHTLKNNREALLSIPFGLFLCWITWQGNSVWYAATIHAVFAVSHEITSIKAHPHMRFDFSFGKTIKT